MKAIRLVLFLLLLFRCDLLLAQFQTASARNISLSSSGASFSRGIEAINSNPANLAFFDRTNLEFSIIPNVYTEISNSVFSYNTYKKYFTGDGNGNPKYLSDQDKNDILYLFSEKDPENLINSVVADIFSLSINYKQLYGGFGISIRERAFNSAGIPKDAFELLLFGNKLNNKYEFDDLSGSGYWFSEYCLGYGFQFLKRGKSKAAFGINLKYLSGTAMYNIENTKADFITTDSSLNGSIKLKGIYSYADFLDGKGNYSLFSKAGKGQSFDVGFSYCSEEVIFFGISLQDLGYIIWKQNVYEVNIDTTGIIKNITDENEYKPFEDLIKNHKTKIDRKTVMLPLSIHAGITINLDQTYFLTEYNLFPISLSAEYNTTLKRENVMSRQWSYYSIGLELKPISWLPIRTGMLFGDMPTKYSLGFGIRTGHFDLDIGFGNLTTLFLSESAKSFSFAFSSKFLF